MKTKIIIFALLLCFEIIGCKSNSNFKGSYRTVSPDSLVYSFNMNNHKYAVEVNNRIKKRGKFKIVELSSEKTLLICNEILFERHGGFIKELDKNGDSTVVGVYHGYKNLGALLFEITEDTSGNLLFRKTRVNEIEKTEIKGKLVQQN